MLVNIEETIPIDRFHSMETLLPRGNSNWSNRFKNARWPLFTLGAVLVVLSTNGVVNLLSLRTALSKALLCLHQGQGNRLEIFAPRDLMIRPGERQPLSFPDMDFQVPHGCIRFVSVVHQLSPTGLHLGGRTMWENTETSPQSGGRFIVTLVNSGQGVVKVNRNSPLLKAYDICV